MIDATINNIIYITLWFLLPLVPAFILFKFLPSDSNVQGPFKGLTIKLAGSFSAYFLLFMICAYVTNRLIRPLDEQYEVWTIEGKVLDEQNMKINAQLRPRLVLLPPTEIRNGEYSVQVIGERKGMDRVEFPIIQILADNYEPEHLSSFTHNRSNYSVLDSFCRIDRKNKVAVYKPIHMRLDLSTPSANTAALTSY